MNFDPAVWGPHYWFFLHTIAQIYPDYPDKAIKRKYYDLIHNMPTFLPIGTMGNKFSDLINKYPVSPYLDNRESLVRWVHFIHNKINEKLNKPKINLNDFYLKYYEEYKPKDLKMKEYYRWREKIIYILILMGATGLIVYLYNK